MNLVLFFFKTEILKIHVIKFMQSPIELLCSKKLSETVEIVIKRMYHIN